MPLSSDLNDLVALEQIEAQIIETELRLAELQRMRDAHLHKAVPRQTLELYEWQQDALGAWEEAGYRGVVEAVTGTGKTRVGLAAIDQAAHEGRQSVVIVPTNELVKQWAKNIARHLPHLRLFDPKRPADDWNVRVSTVQAAIRRGLLTRPGGLIVADECHRYGAETFSTALKSGYDWRLGLTATLTRGDEGDEFLEKYFNGICFSVGYERATKDELIAPFKFASVSVPLSNEERIEYDEYSANIRDTRTRLIRDYGVPEEPIGAFLGAVNELARDHDPGGGGGSARFYLKRFSQRKELLAQTKTKYLTLAAISPAVKRAKGAIVFSQTKDSSEQAAEVLVSTGCTAAAIHSSHDTDEREERLDGLKEGVYQALAAPRILDEGVDVPDADLGVVLASNRSRRQMIQRLGRVLRKRDQKTARFVVLHAAGTVEDPFSQDFVPDFYSDCLPYAVAYDRFVLPKKGELDRLLEFLGSEGDEESQTAIDELTDVATVAVTVDEKTIIDDVPDAESAVESAVENDDEADAPGTLDLASAKYDADYARFDFPPAGCFAAVTDDTIRDYLKSIGRYPLLDAETEVDLAKRIEAGIYARELLDQGDSRFEPDGLRRIQETGDYARDWLCVSNLRLVVSIARKRAGRGVEFADLIQWGNRGLIRAVEKFDYAKGYKFSTYATWWIKQALDRGAADYGNLIRRPVHFLERERKVDELRRREGSTWSEFVRNHPDGLPDHEVTAIDLARMGFYSRAAVSIDWLAEEGPDGGPDVLAALGQAWELDQWVEEHAKMQLIAQLLDIVDIKEGSRTRLILEYRFGLRTGEEETLDAIGKRFSVTRERIRQLEAKGLNSIRAELRLVQPNSKKKVPTKKRLQSNGDKTYLAKFEASRLAAMDPWRWASDRLAESPLFDRSEVTPREEQVQHAKQAAQGQRPTKLNFPVGNRHEQQAPTVRPKRAALEEHEGAPDTGGRARRALVED